MPFKKVGRNKYKSPSGKKNWTKSQVEAYYASDGFTKGKVKAKKKTKTKKK